LQKSVIFVILNEKKIGVKMSTKLTLKEISQLADVSISTVSRVLSDSSYVKSTTRDKVLTVLNSAENNKNSNKLIAFIFPDISNLFFPLLFKGMKSISKMQGYNILISNTENSYETEVEILEDMLKCGVEGIIYIGDYAKKSLIQDILAKGEIPFVFLHLSEAARHVTRNMVFLNACYMPIWAYLNAQFTVSRTGGDVLMGAVTDGFVNFALVLPGIFLLTYFTSFGPVALYGIIKLTDFVKMTIAALWLKRELWVKNLAVQSEGEK